jgi:hypothetical protein
MKLYIACGLTHVPRDQFEVYTKLIHRLAQALKADNEVKYALLNSDPQLALKPFDDRAKLCYLWDRHMVEEADLILAEASFPSTGLGIELQIANERGIPIVLCFGDWNGNKAPPAEYENPDLSKHTLQIGEGYVSLMALGLPTIVTVIHYRSSEEALERMSNAVRTMQIPPDSR